ncbi:MAG TPA: 50S ribosomal protein L25/general stress protein Ctc [Propionibacteriaceae bacterium]|nr:50S ribosomal protein L25/general stress protein Ctc [Propionibacteriaceae bacterium]HPZ49557.1 50S ribosomal protein L25/general stress protein Ctc [Propionibacteriaceae bacterium]HQE30903.1 50S ribosomal protein L25/general stress protein Ctc [Propionibacteriaceae bacterium]
MSEVKLSAESRSEFGKGAARRLRRAQQVPAVMYGHGTDPVHISLPAHETQLALRTANVLLTITIDGGNEQLALPKQVQRDPVRGTVEHIDLVIVRKGEKVTVQVPLVTTGESISDVMVVMDQQTITLEVAATNIPAQIEIDVTGLQVGDTVTAADLKLPEGAVFPGEPGDLMLSAHASPTQQQIDAELDAAVEDATDVVEGPVAEAAAEDGDAAESTEA